MDKKKWKLKLGIILISISVMFFLIIFALPFISMETKVKISLAPILIVVGEVSFWAGTILIGKDVYLKFKERLKSGEWFGKKKDNKSEQ